MRRGPRGDDPRPGAQRATLWPRDPVGPAARGGVTPAEALDAARAIVPSQADAEACGSACYAAGLTIDELAAAIYDSARASGTHVWGWIMAGYYDARATEQIEHPGNTLERDRFAR